ncbi:hypothetical protein [Helicobacter fennelliae]|uniref:Uncharacterized protein n=2 Tax=Helicobacter fennelliae TaxID=215 RepID=T1DVD1_9HELI|nr:hypothetical protein [Helicobacter fennelliae]GAD18432.1 hypothetical protein HFN_2360 [Helicobacter fennelliae MRY12-0050]SQB98848.1 Uncharacterised protein [Helicobacter fennelliae]STP08191.1 Uncharacterised protein [Helicobacter fennelliae]STQ83901.1 Uncharacterised protein [Helicobacter fennelliae]
MNLRVWIFPSICFALFCYSMIFVGIFTYRVNPNISLFQSSSSQPNNNVTDVEALQKELSKKLR